MPRNSPNCSNKRRRCCAAGLVTTRCSPIGLKTGRSNTARWISAAVHNSRPGVCLRKASHRNCGSSWVEAKKLLTGNRRYQMLFIDQQQKQIDLFLQRNVFTQADLTTGEQQQLSKAARNASSNGQFCCLCTNKKRLSEVVLANAFSVFQLSILSTTRRPRWRHSM